jgi:hypothetical protein
MFFGVMLVAIRRSLVAIWSSSAGKPPRRANSE